MEAQQDGRYAITFKRQKCDLQLANVSMVIQYLRRETSCNRLMISMILQILISCYRLIIRKTIDPNSIIHQNATIEEAHVDLHVCIVYI